MDELDDMALLREYTARQSEEAFALLVTRHVNKVYSVALRHTRNAHQAEEITQAVFVILAKKSRQLGKRVILSGWLYHAARLASVTFIRGEIRRARRQEEARMQTLANEEETSDWARIAPILDEAMAGLNETDRHAVVLRYFDGKSMREVGAALGANEEAAKKRVGRALEKLRIFFAKRGVNSTTAIIAGMISANSVQAAPGALAKSVTAAAMTHGAAASASTLTIIKGVSKLMTLSKIKFATMLCLGVLLASGAAVVSVKIARADGASENEKAWELYSQVFAQNLSGPEMSDAAVQVMTNHPPMALIRRSTRPPRFGTANGVSTVNGHVRMDASLVEVLYYAYDLDRSFPQNRVIVPPSFMTRSNHFDYVDTMPQGGREILRRALKDELGLVARREMRENLVLTVRNAGDSGLRKHSDDNANIPGKVNGHNVTMAMLAKELAKRLGVKVTDQTGLVGGFDYNLDVSMSPTPEELIKAFSDQLGLELAPAGDGQQIEFLVAEKVR